MLSYLHEKKINQFKIDKEHNIGSKCKIFENIKLSLAEFHTHINLFLKLKKFHYYMI